MSKGIDDDEEIRLLKLDYRVPLMVCWYFLDSFFDESSIQPEVESKLFKVEFKADYSWSCSPKLLDHFLLLILIRYSDLYLIINKQAAKEVRDNERGDLQRVEQEMGQMISQ